MDEINICPKHDFRLPSRRWLVIAVAVALITTIRSSHRGPRSPGTSHICPAAVPPTLVSRCVGVSGGLGR